MNIWTAAADNNIEKVRHFISSANQTPNSKDENGYTPMHAAAEYGHTELLDYLIEQGGDINIVDNDGDTPLHACESVKIAEYLIARGANPELQNSEGLTPLAKAEEDSEFLDLIRFYQIKAGIIPPNEEESQPYDTITDEQREKLQQIIENGTDADFENYLRECISGNAEAHGESHKRVKTDE